MGAGVARQPPVGGVSHQEGGFLQHPGDVLPVLLHGGGLVLEGLGAVGHVPVVQVRHHAGGVLRRGHPQGQARCARPNRRPAASFSAFGQPFQGRLPACRASLLSRAALGVGQPHGGPAVAPGVLGAPLPPCGGPAAAGPGRWSSPHRGCRRRSAAGRPRPRVRRGRRSARQTGRRAVLSGAHSPTGRPAARSVRRQASMAVALSSAVIRNRLGWQNRSPRPLISRQQGFLGLAGPGRREGQLAALGAGVGDALGAVAAPLAGIHHEQRVGLVQAVLPRHVGGQHHDAVPHVGVGPAHRVVGAVHRVGRGDLVFQDLFCHRHRPPEARVGVVLGVPQRVEAADGVGQGVLLPGVVVQVQGLDEVFVQQPGLVLPHQLGAQHPPQQPEGRVGHPVGAGLPRFREWWSNMPPPTS